MAKDDYDVIAYRILVYLYACKKRKIMFEDITFNEAVRKNVESELYFFDILYMMQEEGLIEGLCFTKAWGGDKLLGSDYREAEITAKGIRYLNDNEKMNKIGNKLKESVDIIAKLASLISVI